jgi:hypothetical protein
MIIINVSCDTDLVATPKQSILMICAEFTPSES